MKVTNITTKQCKMSEVLELFKNITVYHPELIYLGKNVSINAYCVLAASRDSSIRIGDDTLLGPCIVISAADHIYESKSMLIRSQKHIIQPVAIGKDVWIAAGVIILRGSNIPDGCVIGADSLVTRHNILEPYGVYVGNPLRQIKKRQ